MMSITSEQFLMNWLQFYTAAGKTKRKCKQLKKRLPGKVM